MPNCGHDHNDGWNDTICDECGCRLVYFNDEEELAAAKQEYELIMREWLLEQWRKQWRESRGDR